jgi:imidazole glycerol-phosphate synthase subunit HisH
LTIAVLDYGIGNLRSAEKALLKVGADARLVASPDVAAEATGFVLPGVGAFGACLAALRETGLDEVVRTAIAEGRPFLGICVGMQMLYEGSEESPSARGLGVLGGMVRRLPDQVKVPQMQWNRLQPVRPSAMFAGQEDAEPWMYFVHSYAPDASDDVVATCDYGGSVVAAVERGSLWATQFHPEKSGPAGLALMAAFAERCRA